jgi:hypothetical protein
MLLIPTWWLTAVALLLQWMVCASCCPGCMPLRRGPCNATCLQNRGEQPGGAWQQDMKACKQGI